MAKKLSTEEKMEDRTFLSTVERRTGAKWCKSEDIKGKGKD